MGVSPFLPVLRENSTVSLRLALFLTFVGQNGAGCRVDGSAYLCSAMAAATVPKEVSGAVVGSGGNAAVPAAANPEHRQPGSHGAVPAVL